MIVMLWIMLVWFVLTGLLVITGVGVERKPMTPGAAVLAVVVNGAFALTVWSVLQVLPR